MENSPAADAFRLDGPNLISFSGGRTSAYMLWRYLDRYQGDLPPDVYVTFANTGKERPETLRFVHEIGVRWGVTIHWLQFVDWRGRKTAWNERFEEVGFNSAARAGEPFAALIARKGYLPNAATRFCTQELKVRTMGFFMRSRGHKNWTSQIGLRHDEGIRVMRGLERNESGKDPWVSAFPLSRARVTKPDVMEFWLGPTASWPSPDRPQGFDLELAPWEGNCDHCFLKGANVLQFQMATTPGLEDWWIEQEDIVTTMRATSQGAKWVTEYSYRRLRDLARTQGDLFLTPPSDVDYDVECGLACSPDHARMDFTAPV